MDSPDAPIGIEIDDGDRASGGHQRPRPGDVRGEPIRQASAGLSLFDNPNFPAEIEGSASSDGRGADFTARYDFSESPAATTKARSRSGYFDWTGRIRCLYDDTGRTHPLPAHQHRQHGAAADRRTGLTEFEALFRLISEYAQVGYANYNLCNKEGYAQSVWLRNYGEADTAAIGDVIGKYRHIHPDDRTVLLNRLAQFESGEIQSASVSCRVLHDDGTDDMDQNPPRSAGTTGRGEQVIDMLGINYDITALKQTEQELIAAKERAEESNKLKIGLPGQHEPRNPHAAQRHRRLFGTDGYGGRSRLAQRIRRPDPGK